MPMTVPELPHPRSGARMQPMAQAVGKTRQPTEAPEGRKKVPQSG